MARNSKVLESYETEIDVEDVTEAGEIPATALMSLEMGKSTTCPNCKVVLHLLLFNPGEVVPCHRCERLVQVP